MGEEAASLSPVNLGKIDVFRLAYQNVSILVLRILFFSYEGTDFGIEVPRLCIQYPLLIFSSLLSC
jgi:hypothetical protein